MASDRQTADKQAAAISSVVVIVVTFVAYWLVQIQGVREMLALAYG